MKPSHAFLIPLLALLLLAGNAWASPANGIEVHAPWVREAPPTARVLAAYLELHNHGDVARTLVAVESPAFKRVELHRSEEKDGMASMARVTKIMIPAHGKVGFEPGSLHIMLIDPAAPLKSGDEVALTLRFADGSSLTVSAGVRRSVAGAMEHRHGTGHSMEMRQESHGEMKKHGHEH